MKILSGMTGFARTTGHFKGLNWVWEVRSVNGKGLDLRLRLPSEFSGIDIPVRKAFSSIFKRGNLQISLSFQAAAKGTAFQVNEALLDALNALAIRQNQAVSLDQLLQIEGVVIEKSNSVSDEDKEDLNTALVESAKDLAAKLKESRDVEGAALAPLLTEAVDKSEALIAKAEALAAVTPQAIKDKLNAKLTELIGEGFSEDRLVQEAALLALKADVREELDRLAAHCEQARKLISQGSPIGRKLDFLSQEFNRETNTLCSKSSDIDLTQLGLSLKSVIGQFREQAANVE